MSPRIGPSFWDAERKAKAAKLWADGFSAAQIAKMMGAQSRSAVIGVIHRMGLNRRGEASKPAQTTRKANPPGAANFRTAKTPQAFTVSATRVYQIPPPKPLPVFQPHDVPDTARPWTERRFGECAYPVSGAGADITSCCGRTDDGEAYCEAHKRLMYVAPRSGAPRTGNELMRSLRRYA